MGHRVLLVDDVADLRFLLRVVLESDGAFEVVGEAGNGETAVELCSRTQPDVIVLDLSMPTMDGLEALPRLRELAPDAKIVVLSGIEGARAESSTAKLGADAYFEKGTAPATVLDRLRQLLGIEAPPDTGPASVTRLADGELRAIVAHDIRSPLSAVIGFGETLGERWDDIDDATRRGLVARMTAQARALHAITENLLSTGAVELGAMVVDLEAVAPAALLTDLVEILRPVAGQHDLELQVAPNLPVVLVDRARLTQILINLLSNADRHAPPDTGIVLRARADASWVAIDVIDKGPGIPVADRVRVLEKHVRLARDAKGLGLGLFVASALARAMGGSLVVADEGGVGTRATCRVRVAEVAD